MNERIGESNKREQLAKRSSDGDSDRSGQARARKDRTGQDRPQTFSSEPPPKEKLSVKHSFGDY